MATRRFMFVRLIVWTLSALLAWPWGVVPAVNDGSIAPVGPDSAVRPGQSARAESHGGRTRRDVDALVPGMLSDDDEVGGESHVPGTVEWACSTLLERHPQADRSRLIGPRAAGRAQLPQFDAASVHRRC